MTHHASPQPRPARPPCWRFPFLHFLRLCLLLLTAPAWAGTGAPVITSQPVSAAVLEGEKASFFVGASGTPTPKIRWQRLTGDSWMDVEGAAEARLVLTHVNRGEDGAVFHAVVSNKEGTVVSQSITLSVQYFHLTRQPEDALAVLGQHATFAVGVQAGPGGPLAFQWLRQAPDTTTWSAIPGATGPAYTTPTATAGDQGTRFAARVTQGALGLLSQAARLSVNLGLSPSRSTVAPGATCTFSGMPGDATGLSWSLVEPGSGNLTPHSDGRSATYQAPRTPGTYHVAFRSQVPALTALAEIQVTGDPTVSGNVRVRVSPAKVLLAPGQRLRACARVEGSTSGVVWTLQEGAAGGSITQDGLYTAPQREGLIHLVASLRTDARISDVLEVTVAAEELPHASFSQQGFRELATPTLQASPRRLTLDAGASAYLTAGVSGTDAQGVTWSLREGSGAGILTPAPMADDLNCILYTAPQALGVYHAVATSLADPALTTSVVVEVGRRIEVQVAPGQATLDPGGQVLLVGSILNTEDMRLTWSLLEREGGTLSVNEDGTATFQAHAPGLYHVTATSVADPLRSVTVPLAVNGAAPVSVSVLPANLRVLGGTQVRFLATVSGSADQRVAWSCSDGTITQEGLLTAPSAGTLSVTATAFADPSQGGAATLTAAATPVFTSLPPPSAALGQPYTYLPVAQHAGGLAVTQSLVQAPEGVVLSEGMVSWTPQARDIGTKPTFLLQAVDDLGGTALQTWTPDLRVVGVDLGTSYYAPTGITVVPGTVQDYSTRQVRALVDDGAAYDLYPGGGSTDGRFWVPGVPAGPYLLNIDNQYTLWTESEIRRSSKSLGRPDVGLLRNDVSTPFALDLRGLEPWTPGSDFIELFSLNARHYLTLYDWDFATEPPAAGATTVTGSLDLRDLLPVWKYLCEVEPAKGDDFLVAHFASRSSSAGLPYAILSRAARLSSTAILSGQPTRISADLAAPVGVVRSMGATLRRTGMDAVVSQIHPRASVQWYYLAADAVPFGQELGFQAAGTPDMLIAQWFPASVPPGDWTFDELRVLDPWDPAWTRRLLFDAWCQVSYTLPGTTRPWRLRSILRDAQPWQDGTHTELRLVLGPPRNVLIDGLDAQIDHAVSSLTPLLTWDPPQVGTPATYQVVVYRLGIAGSATTATTAAVFSGLTQGRIRLPAGVLQSGASYVFAVQAQNTSAPSLWRSTPNALTGVLTLP